MRPGGNCAQTVERARQESAGGHHAEAVHLAEECIPELRREIEQGGTAGAEARRALFLALQTAGISLFEQGNFEAAFQYLREAVSVAQASGDTRAVGAALHELARIAAEWHNFPQAVEFGKAAIRACTLADCEPHIAMQGLAVACELTGNFAEAEAALRLVRESAEARGDWLGLGQALHELGLAAAGRNRWDEALVCLAKAVRIKWVSGDSRGFQNSLRILQELLARNPTAPRPAFLEDLLESM